jgi:sugar phosphate isomerase/epimerase
MTAPTSAPAIPVTLSTGSLYTLGTARAFEHAARAGYDGVELLVDDRWDTRQPPYLRRLVQETGTPIHSVHSPFVPIPSWPRDEIGRVKKALALAEDLGARVLNLHVPRRLSDLTLSALGKTYRFPFLPAPADQHRFTRWLMDGGLDETQRATPVTIAVENLPARNFLGRRLDVHALNTWPELSLFHKLCLDTTHCGTWGVDPTHILDRLGGRVVHVHLSDFSGRHDGPGRQHQPIGAGHLPLGSFLQQLAARHYDGSVVVELTPFALPVQDESKLTAELRRNAEFCHQRLAAALPA